MSITTGDVLGSASWADDADHEWLHLLVGDWQLLADLSFADLTLWIATDDGWRAAAHVRPTTGFSLFAEDLVGTPPPRSLTARLGAAETAGESSTAAEITDDGESVQADVVPVRRAGHIISVLSRHMRMGNVRRRGRLETTYLGLAESLLRMVADGTFPDGGGAGSGRGGSPRVGDGVLAVDATGQVTYASPNAVSAMRRLGIEANVTGLNLATTLSEHGVLPVGAREEASAVVAGRAPWHAELRNGSASVMVRAVPLIADGRRFGAALLLRDITEVRRRDQELLTKDATIREIHHRVKNNLQSVAAVLRLQARRLPDEDARQALADAGRRVAVIAAVHESLSEGFAGGAVDFDEIAMRGLASSVEVARPADAQVSAHLEGSFGMLTSEDATSLAMVIGELVQNAVEHGLEGGSGSVVVKARREGEDLTVDVVDSGQRDVPVESIHERRAGERSGLGTQIVRTFVEDLHGSIEWLPGESGGIDARFTARLRPIEAT